MQRHGILNSHIAKVLADLGHTDTICISDCGLPVPEGVQKIDLALDFGVPSFEQVVSIIAKHMKSEAVHAAKEIKEHNPEAYDFLEATFPSNQYEWIETSHEAFKEATKQCKCIIELVKHLRMPTLSCAPIVFSAIVPRATRLTDPQIYYIH